MEMEHAAPQKTNPEELESTRLDRTCFIRLRADQRESRGQTRHRVCGLRQEGDPEIDGTETSRIPEPRFDNLTREEKTSYRKSNREESIEKESEPVWQRWYTDSTKNLGTIRDDNCSRLPARKIIPFTS